MINIKDDVEVLNTWVDVEYPTLSRIISFLKNNLDHPQKLKRLMDVIIQQCSIMLGKPQHFPFFIETVALLSTWPMRLGFAKAWSPFVERAYQLSEEAPMVQQRHQLVLLKSKMAFDRGNFEEASQYAFLSLELSFHHGVARHFIASLSHTSTVLMYQGKADDALELLSRTDWTEFVQYDATTKIQFMLANLTVYRRRGMTEEVRKLIEQLKPETLELADRRIQAVWLHNVGLVEEVNGNYQTAITCYSSAKTMFAQMSDSSEIGLITELARVNLYVGNLDIANEYYWQARQQADQILDYIRGMKIRAEIALLYLAQGHLDQALSENNIALQRARAMSDVPDTNRLTGNLGIILFHMGNLAEAKEYLEIDHANSKHQNQALAHNSAYLSRIYKSIGDHALAQDFAQIAVSISIEKGYRHLQVIAYRALAECSITTQDSQVYWKKALGLSQTLGLRFDEAACLLGLSVLELNSGEKENLWDTGIHLLELLGANGWINKLTPTDSLMLPFLS